RFLGQCVEIAEILRADCVSFWSGAADDNAEREVVERRLVESCRRLIEFAHHRSVKLAFEPEPGMVVDTMWWYYILTTQLNDTDVEDYVGKTFGLTIDVNHLQCSEASPIARWIDDEQVESYPDRVFNIHISDGRHGVHDHLMFGEGEIDFPPIFRAL